MSDVDGERPSKAPRLSLDTPDMSMNATAPESLSEAPDALMSGALEDPGDSIASAELGSTHGMEEFPSSENPAALEPSIEHPTTVAAAIAEAPSQPASSSTAMATPYLAGPRTATGSPPALSKRALKRQRKQEYYDSQRDVRRLRRKDDRARRRERAKEARAAVANAAASSNGDPTSNGQLLDAQGNLLPATEGTRARKKAHRPVLSGVTVVLDCGFDELMTDREIKSLAAQITRCYSDNCQVERSVELVVAGFKEGTRLRQRFEGPLQGHHQNWKGVRFLEEGLAETLGILEREREQKTDQISDSVSRKTEQSLSKDQAKHAEESSEGIEVRGAECGDSRDGADKHNDNLGHDPNEDEEEIVYLTADSLDTLHELAPRGVYIVGALVDRNRHKGICYRAAEDIAEKAEGSAPATKQRMKTARLPISEHMRLASRQVLTTNHVVEILLGKLGGDSWGEAFSKAVPKRKGGILKENEDGNTGANDEEGEDADEDVQEREDATEDKD